MHCLRLRSYGDRGTRLLCRAANIHPDGVWIVKVSVSPDPLFLAGC